jgi:hypothetical protein
VINLSTAKCHISNILVKLGVQKSCSSNCSSIRWRHSWVSSVLKVASSRSTAFARFRQSVSSSYVRTGPSVLLRGSRACLRRRWLRCAGAQLRRFLHRPVATHRADHGRARSMRRHRRPGPNPAPAPTLPITPDEQPPENPGLIALTVAEIKRLFTLVTRQFLPEAHHLHWTGGADVTTPAPDGSTTALDCSVTCKHNPTGKCGCRSSEASPRTIEQGGWSGVPAAGRSMLRGSRRVGR